MHSKSSANTSCHRLSLEQAVTATLSYSSLANALAGYSGLLADYSSREQGMWAQGRAITEWSHASSPELSPILIYTGGLWWLGCRRVAES